MCTAGFRKENGDNLEFDQLEFQLLTAGKVFWQYDFVIRSDRAFMDLERPLSNLGWGALK